MKSFADIVGLLVLAAVLVVVGPFITAWAVNTAVHIYAPNAPSVGWTGGLAIGLLCAGLRGGK